MDRSQLSSGRRATVRREVTFNLEASWSSLLSFGRFWICYLTKESSVVISLEKSLHTFCNVKI